MLSSWSSAWHNTMKPDAWKTVLYRFYFGIDTVFARSDAPGYYLFYCTILCGFYSGAAFIKLSVVGKIFCNCKGFEKSQFYTINEELRCSLISHCFATKQYLHSTSNPFPRFLPMSSHNDCPPFLKKCQTSLNSVRSCTYCVCSFGIAIQAWGLFTWACATRILAAASIREWWLFPSARPEVRRLIESGVWSNKYGNYSRRVMCVLWALEHWGS